MVPGRSVRRRNFHARQPWLAGQIDLRGTRLDVVDGPRVEVTRSESDWVTCRVVDGQYQGFGGPTNLLEILEHFREFLGMQAPK